MKTRQALLITLLLACMPPATVLAQGTSTNGAPPDTHVSGKSPAGKAAGLSGGAGSGANYGTNPATLSKEEQQRQRAGKASAASQGKDM